MVGSNSVTHAQPNGGRSTCIDSYGWARGVGRSLLAVGAPRAVVRQRVIDGRGGLDFAAGVCARSVELGLQVVHEVGVDDVFEVGLAVVRRERVEDLGGALTKSSTKVFSLAPAG